MKRTRSGRPVVPLLLPEAPTDSGIVSSDEALRLLDGVECCVIDVETTGLDWKTDRLLGIGLGIKDKKPVFVQPDKTFEKLVKCLWSKRYLVGYNINFDLKFLHRVVPINFDSLGTLIDLQIAAYLLEPTLFSEASLETVCRHYVPDFVPQWQTVVAPYKKGNMNSVPSEVLAAYCCEDVTMTQLLLGELASRYPSYLHRVLDIDLSALKALLECELTGMVLDATRVKETEIALRREVDKVELELAEAGFSGNFQSAADVRRYFTEQGLRSPVETAKGRESWAKSVLNKIDHPVARTIVKVRLLRTLLSTHLGPLLGKEVIYPQFRLTHTVTGRLTSVEPNVQNIPRLHSDIEHEIRRCYVARPGYIMYSLDYSQQELRIAAHIAAELGDPTLINMLESGVDVHSEVAKAFFDLTGNEPDFYQVYRRRGKDLLYGFLYGLGVNGMASRLGWTVERAKKHRDQLLQRFRGLRLLFDETRRRVASKGYVKNLAGYRYHMSEDQAYKAVNYIVQGTAAYIIKSRLPKLVEFLRDCGGKLLNVIHDEVLIELPMEHGQEDLLVLVNIMSAPDIVFPRELPVDVSRCDPSWADKTAVSGKFVSGF